MEEEFILSILHNRKENLPGKVSGRVHSKKIFRL